MVCCYVMCDSVLQRVLQCVAVCCSVMHSVAEHCRVLQSVTVCCSVLQSVTVCCRVLQSVAVVTSSFGTFLGGFIIVCAYFLRCVISSVPIDLTFVMRKRPRIAVGKRGEYPDT